MQKQNTSTILFLLAIKRHQLVQISQRMPRAPSPVIMDRNQLVSDIRDLQQPLITSEGKSNGVERLGIDDVLNKYCGECGRWQIRHFVLTSLAWALEAFHTMVMIFADHEPKWRCIGPGCDPWAPSICGLPPGSWEWVDKPNTSIVTEWALFCGERYKVGLVEAVFFCGCMIGAGIFGHLSDSSFGRKGTLAIVCVLNGILGCLTALSHNYYLYITLRLLTGLSTGGVGMCAYVLATEPIGPTNRGVAGMSTFYFFSGGIALLSGIAYIFPSWRSLYIASSMPSILFTVTVLPFLSESPRWYLVKGKIKKAMKVMRDIAEGNGNHIPQGVELVLDEEADNATNEGNIPNDLKDRAPSTREEVKASLIDVLKSPVTRTRLILAVLINFCCSIVYYGLSLNVANLDTNIYINVLLNAFAEWPAFLLTAVMLDKLGRKPLTVATLWFSGFFCMWGSMVQNYGVWKYVRMICGVLGIFGMAGTYNLLFIYTTELFPTVVRNAALGCATQASHTGAILAPFVVVLGGGYPFMVFAVFGYVGGILGFCLPETLNQPLYDTMAGMEEGEAIRRRT